MAKCVRIQKAGEQESIQGNYRFGYMGKGIPPSGPMDEFSHHMGNRLLRNDPQAASIEFAFIGGSMVFLKETVIAITGADFPCLLNGKEIQMWRTIRVQTGDELVIGKVRQGARGYLAIAGGFNVPEVLDSTSTYVTGGIGGFHGRYLRDMDVLEDYDFAGTKGLDKLWIPRGKELFEANKDVIYFMEGAQYDFYEEESIRQLLETDWTASDINTRTTVRLKGLTMKFKPRQKDPAESPDPFFTADDGVPIGSMHTPGGSELAIAMQDQLTASGYCKVGVVVKASLDAIGQIKPGDRIRFAFISLTEARQLRKHQIDLLKDESQIVEDK